LRLGVSGAELFCRYLYETYLKRGELIDDFDIAIAAIAMSHKCGVLSANLKHFERIKDLEIKSWL